MDLTGTVWVFNNSLSFPSNAHTYNLSFVSNNVNYTSIYVSDSDESWLDYRYTGTTTQSYTAWDGWTNNAYKTIEISGGTDTTNSNLILWLKENATQYIPSSSNTKIGTKSIVKKKFGQLEIVKEVLNGKIIYST